MNSNLMELLNQVEALRDPLMEELARFRYPGIEEEKTIEKQSASLTPGDLKICEKACMIGYNDTLKIPEQKSINKMTRMIIPDEDIEKIMSQEVDETNMDDLKKEFHNLTLGHLVKELNTSIGTQET